MNNLATLSPSLSFRIVVVLGEDGGRRKWEESLKWKEEKMRTATMQMPSRYVRADGDALIILCCFFHFSLLIGVFDY